METVFSLAKHRKEKLQTLGALLRVDLATLMKDAGLKFISTTRKEQMVSQLVRLACNLTLSTVKDLKGACVLCAMLKGDSQPGWNLKRQPQRWSTPKTWLNGSFLATKYVKSQASYLELHVLHPTDKGTI